MVDSKQPVWLDCDPGHDDAIAIILAGYDPRLRLLGISTVAGNQTIEKVTDNALRVLAAAGLSNIPVVKGQSKPLMRPALHCPQIHGDSGLDGPLGGPILPPPISSPHPGPAAIEMYERIKCWSEKAGNAGTKVQVVATGALSNIALLLMLYPDIVGMIEVVLMGGALGIGNTGPVVEFNIQTDPEAASVVFSSSVTITMIPLEVTHTALVSPEILRRIQSHGPSAFLDLIAELLVFFSKTYEEVFKFPDPPLHDPCAVAFVIAPHIFKSEHLRVDIETCSPLSSGQTVVDIWHQSGREANATVCMSMDVEQFWDLVIPAIHAAVTQSPLTASPRLMGATQKAVEKLVDGSMSS